MSITSVLAIYDGTEGASTRLDHAISFALAQDAHLTVLCFELDPSYPPTVYGGAGVAVYAGLVGDAQERLAASVKAAEAQLAASGLRYDLVEEFCFYDHVAQEVCKLARFADVTMLHQPRGLPLEETRTRVLEAALFGGDSPVLVMPAAHDGPIGTRCLIAWNGGGEAMRAVRAALPILRGAGHAEIAMVSDIDAPLQGEDLAKFLFRHGVEARVSTVDRDGRSVAEALTTYAAAAGADLIVMGAYGHSRVREFFLGGATRDILNEGSVPLLMTH